MKRILVSYVLYCLFVMWVMSPRDPARLAKTLDFMMRDWQKAARLFGGWAFQAELARDEEIKRIRL